jgi:FAD-linked oxidoreductase
MTWRNWAGNQTCEPVRVARPRSTADVVATVRGAASQDLRVKAIGAGHSFTGVGLTDGVQLDLTHLSGIRSVDRATGLVRVGAGTPLHRLNAELHAHGLALPNLGDVDRQSVAGATSTGTHGTGARLPGLAAMIAAVELVTGSGEVLQVGERHELFGAVRLGLGALGVVTELTLRCVPAFRLRAVEEPMPLDAVLERLDDWWEQHDHAELHWFPHADRALTKRNDRVDDPRRPVGRVRALVDDEVLSNGVFEVVNRVAAARPAWTPTINAVASRALSRRDYVDDSFRVFVSPRRVRFTEMEYAVPRADVHDVIAEVRRWIATHDERIAIPIEVRAAAADDVWLSTANERPSAYVAVHHFHRTDNRRYFGAVEAIMAEHAGRPHWGKLHGLDADRLRALYPRFDDFVAARARLDPQRLLANDYLDRVLGRV